MVCFDETAPLKIDPPAKKMVKCRPSSIIGPTLETVEPPVERPAKTVVVDNKSTFRLADDAPASPMKHHKKSAPASKPTQERPITPMKKRVAHPSKDPIVFAGSPIDPVRHVKKFVPAPDLSLRDESHRPATPGRKHIRQPHEFVTLSHDSPIAVRHHHRRPASPSAPGALSTIVLTDANALLASPIRSVTAHMNGRRPDTPTRARPPVNSSAASSSIDLSEHSAVEGGEGDTVYRRSRKAVTKESLAAMYTPAIPRPRSAKKPAAEGMLGARTSSFASYSLDDITASCDNSQTRQIPMKRMGAGTGSSSTAVMSSVFRVDEPNAMPEKPFVPSKRMVSW